MCGIKRKIFDISRKQAWSLKVLFVNENCTLFRINTLQNRKKYY